jgi:hypothetical protein
MGGAIMKKLLFVLMLVGLLVGCSSSAEKSDCPACEPVEVTRQVEVIKEVKSPEVGPWTIRQSITQTGQYLVPEEMQPGQWAYKADDPTKGCSASTYSDLSGSSDSILDFFYSDNKGFFVLNDNVRMVELNWKNCTWSRIGD